MPRVTLQPISRPLLKTLQGTFKGGYLLKSFSLYIVVYIMSIYRPELCDRPCPPPLSLYLRLPATCVARGTIQSIPLTQSSPCSNIKLVAPSELLTRTQRQPVSFHAKGSPSCVKVTGTLVPFHLDGTSITCPISASSFFLWSYSTTLRSYLRGGVLPLAFDICDGSKRMCVLLFPNIAH